MTITVAIAAGALFAAIAPLWAMWITLKQRTDMDHETRQAKRIDELEEDLEACRRRNRELLEENLDLMRRHVRGERG